jgi:hypothetical protein
MSSEGRLQQSPTGGWNGGAVSWSLMGWAIDCRTRMILEPVRIGIDATWLTRCRLRRHDLWPCAAAYAESYIVYEGC